MDHTHNPHQRWGTSPSPQPTDQATRDVALVRNLYDAFHYRRQNVLAKLVADDCRMTQSPSHPFPGTFVGLEQIAQSLATTFTSLGGPRTAVLEVAADGRGTVLALVELQWNDGETMEVLERFRLESGQVTDFRPFPWDPARLQARASQTTVLP